MAITQEKPRSNSLLDFVREQCAWVATKADHVRINDENISAYVSRLLQQYSIITQLDDNHFISDNKEAMASYVLALDSLNFGSGYFRQAYDAGIVLGYSSLALSLKKAFEQQELDTPSKWLDVNVSTFHKIFDIPENKNKAVDELFCLFTAHLQETGRIISETYKGKSLTLVESSQNSAVNLVDIVSRWKNFNDTADYKSRKIPLLKRAQILAADMQLARITSFRDIDQLTIFADNRIPHVLHHDGILSYSSELAEKIESRILLEQGCPMETELRAASIHVGELMKIAAIAEGYDVTSANIDHILWHRGAEPAMRALPTHRTYTIFY